MDGCIDKWSPTVAAIRPKNGLKSHLDVTTVFATRWSCPQRQQHKEALFSQAERNYSNGILVCQDEWRSLSSCQKPGLLVSH